MPPIDDIVNDAVLVSFTNKIIKDDNFLLVHWEVFKRNDCVPRRFDDLVTNVGVNICGKVFQNSLILVLVEVFQKEINLVKL